MAICAMLVTTCANAQNNGTTHVESRQFTVEDLKQLCDSRDDGKKLGCLSYIMGASEGLQIGAASESGPAKTHYCIPVGISFNSLALSVRLKIAGDLVMFPADKDMAAVSFIAASLTEDFPCKDSDPSR